MSATYINGYVKDLPLRNVPEEEIVNGLQRFTKTLGRKALRRNQKPVFTSKPSIQGVWTPELWQSYPKFELEKKRKIPEEYYEPFPNKPVQKNIMRPPPASTFLKRKFPVFDHKD